MNPNLVKEFRRKLRSSNIADYHGLKSPGLTCYLNSVLQVLFMTEDFREAVKQCCSDDSTTIDSHLADLFSDLEKQNAKTHNIIKKLGITNVYEQRDAAEYFEKILCLSSPETSKSFKGALDHRTKCLKCKHISDTSSAFWILPLTVEESCRQIYSVEKGLEDFFKGEKFCGDNQIYCTHCNKKQNAEFGCEIARHPQILTLLLKRFSFDYKRRCHVKLHCEMEIPKALHMKHCKYDLYALVDHFCDLTGGHYTAQIKSFETQGWYRFNDDIVRGVRNPLFRGRDECLRSGTAYLLMYRKVRKHPEKSDEGHLTACGAKQLEDVHHAEENFKPLNGDLLNQSHDGVGLTKQTKFSRGLESKLNHGLASLRPHKKMIQEDEGQKRIEPNSKQLERKSTDHFQCLNTRGSPTAHHANCMLETKNTKVTRTDRETQKLTHSRTEITTKGNERSLSINRLETAEGKVDNSVRAAAIETGTKVENSPGNAAKSRDEVIREPWR
ncbi:ubiquitin carboxyl-terminal hydrolase 50 isoform X1 [Labrus bergylta]|uniref:ubiquitin carboxyl-terminal hydrolase 50 isoform X1 n=2 Tax=Labrus bergylta TaxID=56723 RepID=UPI0033137762